MASFDNTVSVLRGNGDGTFQPHVDYAAGLVPNLVVMADFNGDSKVDLAVANDLTNRKRIVGQWRWYIPGRVTTGREAIQWLAVGTSIGTDGPTWPCQLLILRPSQRLRSAGKGDDHFALNQRFDLCCH